MEIGFELPDDDEVDMLINTAWALAVAEFGSDPPYEEVRKIFIRLLFEGERLSDE